MMKQRVLSAIPKKVHQNPVGRGLADHVGMVCIGMVADDFAAIYRRDSQIGHLSA
jgi:hypothetical protein